MQIISGILTVVLILLSISLIVVVVMQTPKSEGFGGATSAPGSNFRGKAGYDEMLSGYTRMIAIGWFVNAFVLAVLNELSSGRS